ncbi:ammonia-forming cytochrome c nitrite reductase subunit c552 [Myxococcota bacterium]|nr:ammonia-forming cytochrome c nitrite reductase subunit c552 [Myxococcota bacterium]
MTTGSRTSKLIIGLVVAAAVAFGLTGLLVNIFEHKQEAKAPFFTVVPLDDTIDDPAVWGKNFPLQYDSYKKTVDMTRTRYGGSEALRHDPDERDPRTAVTTSKIEEDPRLPKMWAGYAFAKDFREERGHAYMLEDQLYTKRTLDVKQPGTCLNCHASVYTTYKKLGNGDIMAGFEAMNKTPYSEAKAFVKHPVACIDCHDPATMALRITRPGFMEGIKKVKALQGKPDYDVNRDATRQEMRSFVCGQCHVEYYFKGDEKRLTFPWDKGVAGDEILAYYEENGHKDWSHAKTGAPMLKAQHPEFELWSRGTHGRAGVACADCHMPYQRTGAQKVSDHHVRSPLLNIQAACQTCHRVDEKELLGRAETIQERFTFSRNLAFDALMNLIDDLEAQKAAGVPDDKLAEARNFQRRASFLIDFVEAENSTGFHADQEAVRLLTQAMDYVRKGQLSLRGGQTAAVTPATTPTTPGTETKPATEPAKKDEKPASPTPTSTLPPKN